MTIGKSHTIIRVSLQDNHLYEHVIIECGSEFLYNSIYNFTLRLFKTSFTLFFFIVRNVPNRELLREIPWTHRRYEHERSGPYAATHWYCFTFRRYWVYLWIHSCRSHSYGDSVFKIFNWEKTSLFSKWHFMHSCWNWSYPTSNLTQAKPPNICKKEG